MENKENTMRIGSKWSLLRDALHRFFLIFDFYSKEHMDIVAFMSTDYTDLLFCITRQSRRGADS